LLTEVYLPAEKGMIQGINEFMVFSATAFTAFSSGYLHHTLGWETLNRYTIPVVCFAGCLILLLSWQLRQRQANRSTAYRAKPVLCCNHGSVKIHRLICYKD
jgi:hypothetical protein